MTTRKRVFGMILVITCSGSWDFIYRIVAGDNDDDDGRTKYRLNGFDSVQQQVVNHRFLCTIREMFIRFNVTIEM